MESQEIITLAYVGVFLALGYFFFLFYLKREMDTLRGILDADDRYEFFVLLKDWMSRFFVRRGFFARPSQEALKAWEMMGLHDSYELYHEAFFVPKQGGLARSRFNLKWAGITTVIVVVVVIAILVPTGRATLFWVLLFSIGLVLALGMIAIVYVGNDRLFELYERIDEKFLRFLD
ncbi:MAG: hypothetical protein SWK76_16910 [Actinomycetota bacterium]|nr:hypothetical protein [Actinomycetota bacterium]